MPGEAVKWLDRLAPNLSHMCRFIWELISTNKLPLETQWGHLGGFRDSTAGPIGTKFGTGMRIRLGMGIA